MAETSKPANDGGPTTASAWLVALAEDGDSDELRRRFERWLAADPVHARDWEEISRTAELVRSGPPLHEQEWGAFLRQRRAARSVAQAATVHAVPAAPAPVARGPFAARRAFLVAALAAAACLLLVVGTPLLTRFGSDFVTATAERSVVDLVDGTRVHLGPESALDVAYDRNARRVRLVRGQAFFEIAEDHARPFVVSAKEVEVRDIGTAFDVRLDSSVTDIAVRDGIVEVTAAGTTRSVAERLEAGDWLRVPRSGPIERGRLAADAVAAWTQGHLVVKSQPVAEVVAALRPYFDGLVVLRGASLAAQPLTGIYNLSDPVEALRAVARAQGASFHRLTPWLVVIAGD
ncbi:FecR family protein [Reyranella sp.]|uniref:FecR family protein n=1 Tax=Reyranella sp. TaxID=1929291 RepID=UPI003BAB3F5C